METITQLIWAVAPSLLVGITMAWFNRNQKKRDDKDEQKERNRIKGETLRLDLLVATAQLGYATTMAMKRGSTNGEVEPAVEQYEKAMRHFREFEREQMVRTTTE